MRPPICLALYEGSLLLRVMKGLQLKPFRRAVSVNMPGEKWKESCFLSGPIWRAGGISPRVGVHDRTRVHVSAEGRTDRYTHAHCSCHEAGML